jgi:hypothetical protein
MKIYPINQTDGYYDRVSYNALHGICQPSASRINSGAFREWINTRPVQPACVLHLSPEALKLLY